MFVQLRSYLKYFVITILIVCLNCSIEEPKAPSWDVDIMVPLTSKSYIMAELADDSENLYAEGNEFGALIEGDFDTTYVGDDLKLESIHEKASLELGVFEIAAADTQSDSSLTLADFWKESANFIGQTVPVPAFNFQVGAEGGAKYEFEDFIFIVIDSGAADLKIVNQFKIPLGLPLKLALKDYITNRTISTYEFDEQIPVDSTVVIQLQIRNQAFSNKLYLEFQGESPGSSGTPVEMDMKKRILILELSISNLFVSQAKAKIPEIHFSKTEQVKLTNEMIITEAKFRSGRFKFNVFNHLPINSHFTLTFPDLVDRNNEAFKLNLDLLTQERFENEEIDLSDWILRTDSNPTDMVQMLHVAYEGYTDSTKEQIIELTKKDSISVDTYLEDVTFEYVKGAVNRLKIKVPDVEQDLDLRYKLKDVRIKNASLKLHVFNRVAFPIELDVRMIGSRNTGGQRYYSLRETILPASIVPSQGASIEQVTHVTIDAKHSQYNSFIDFINLIPDNLAMNGHVFIGQPGVEGMVHREDYVFGKYTVKVPFELSFGDTTINFDTLYININPPDFEAEKPDSIDEQLDAEITNDITDATFWVALENHLPIAVDVLVRMDTSLAQVFGTGNCIVNKSIQLSAGTIGEDGIVTKSSMDTISIALTPEEFDLFKNNSSPPKAKTIVIGTQLHLPGTQGKTIIVQADDYVAIRKSYVRFQYPVNEDSF